jgi:hypothetical protein
LSKRTTAQVMADVFRVPMSVGTVSQCEKGVRLKLTPLRFASTPPF